MFQYATAQKNVDGSIKCNNDKLTNVIKDVWKQCYCYDDKGYSPKKPKYVTDEHDMKRHKCPGNIFYTLQKDANGTRLSFEDAIKLPYTVKKLNSKDDWYQCNSRNMGDAGSDDASQCFCDYDGWYPQARVNEDKAKFEAEKAAKLAQQAAITAAQEEAAAIAAAKLAEQQAQAEKSALEATLALQKTAADQALAA